MFFLSFKHFFLGAILRLDTFCAWKGHLLALEAEKVTNISGFNLVDFNRGNEHFPRA